MVAVEAPGINAAAGGTISKPLTLLLHYQKEIGNHYWMDAKELKGRRRKVWTNDTKTMNDWVDSQIIIIFMKELKVSYSYKMCLKMN